MDLIVGIFKALIACLVGGKERGNVIKIATLITLLCLVD